MAESKPLPICFSLPENAQALPPRLSRERHQLHGADDLLTLFKLKPLWERSVKSYVGLPKSKLREQAAVAFAREQQKNGTNRKDEDGNGKNDEAGNSQNGAVNTEAERPLVMEKTYVNYVKDLPGEYWTILLVSSGCICLLLKCSLLGTPTLLLSLPKRPSKTT